MAPSPQTLQFDLLGRELKCSICLSLFKQASSLSCNHTFCTSCILQSMKRSPSCPLCKVPTTRREVRAAPQMDNLVAIYVSMGAAAGLDLMASQAAPADMEPDIEEARNGVKRSKKRGVLSNITNSAKRSAGRSKVPVNSPKCALRGRSLAKKRVQVPLPSSLKGELGLSTPKAGSAQVCEFSDIVESTGMNGLSERGTGPFDAGISGTPVLKRCVSLHEERNAKAYLPITTLPFEDRRMNNNSDKVLGNGSNVKTNNCSLGDELPSGNLQAATECDGINLKPNSSSAEIDTARRTLEPFFWLKDESSEDSGAAHVTQETESFLVPQPNFSDLKDTEDDLSDAAKDNAVANDVSDSEEVNCTQLPFEGFNLQALKAEDSLNNTVDCVLNKKGKDWESADSGLKQKVPSSYERKNKRGPSQTLQKDLRSTRCRVSRDETIEQTQQDEPDECNKKFKDEQVSETYIHDDSKKTEAITGTKRKGKGRAYNRLGKRVKCRKADKADAMEIENESTDKGKDYAQERERKGRKTTVQASVSFEHSKADLETDKSVGDYPDTDNAAPGCVFCGGSEYSEVTGPMKYYNRKGVPVPLQNMTTETKVILVHSNCAEWAPNVYFVGDVANNLMKESVRGQKIKCYSCGKKGAALGCCLRRCKRSYHYPCARAEACKWNEDEFIMFCSEHACEKFPVKGQKASLDHCSPSMDKACGATSLVKESANGSKSGTQQWQCGTTNKWVLCGSALDSKGKEQLAAFAKLTGATVTKVWSSNVTHVIAGTDQNGAARRTLKFLLAILQGKWILKLDWLKACIEAGRPVNEEMFEIQSDIHGVLQGPKQGRLRASSKDSKLFQGFQFYFMTDFLPAYKGDLMVLIAAGGGVVLNRKPVISVSDTTQKHTIIVYNNETPASTSTAAASEIMKRRQAEAKEVGMKVDSYVLPHDWILESIASSKLQPMG